MYVSAIVISIVTPAPISGSNTVVYGVFASVSASVVIAFSGNSAIGDTAIANCIDSSAMSVTAVPKNIAGAMIGKMSIFAGIPITDTSPYCVC